jgi:hypothetical protein
LWPSITPVRRWQSNGNVLTCWHCWVKFFAKNLRENAARGEPGMGRNDRFRRRPS